MKESVSATTLFQIVILFILLFTAIMCLTINNANAFGVKDQLINIIELSQGKFLDNNGELSEEIVDALASATYRSTGYCEDNYVGYRRDGVQVTSGEKASVCIKEVFATSEIDNYIVDILGSNTVSTNDFVPGRYYQIVVFYQLDLPVINQVYNMQTKGETKIIYDSTGLRPYNNYPIVGR